MSQSIQNKSSATSKNDAGNKFVAHRGYQRHYPENTLLAFEEAIKAGAKYFELDVQLSADGVAMVYHDADLQRISMRVEQVKDLKASDLIKISAYEPGRFAERFKTTKINTLAEIADLLKRYPQVQCYVEIKAENCEHFSHEQILGAVSSAIGDVVDQCLLISFDTDLIASARLQGWPRLGWVLTRWSQIDMALQNARYLDVVFCNVNKLDEAADISGVPWRWVVYEIDQIEQAQALFNLGVDQIETFAIQEMIEEYTKLGTNIK